MPPEIGQFAELTNLALASNRLKTLPAEVGQLKKLRYLDISDNALTALPAEISLLSHLTALSLEHNPLPPEVLRAWHKEENRRFKIPKAFVRRSPRRR